MVIQPNTDITLYTGVDIGTCQQLAFSSINKQSAYFQSKILKQYVNCTVVKEKIGTIKVAIKPTGQAGTGEITGAELASANYMSFINPSFDNKRIYCYIVDYVYLNNETAEIRYMIDYWQTWMFDVTFEPMYIDREHLSQTDWAKIEANPYDPTVPQMITAEPLPTPIGYEKPFYDVSWFSNNNDGEDGIAFMSNNIGGIPIIKNTVKEMLTGNWKYWSCMLVQAPTDWTKFGSFDALDSSDKPWQPGDIAQDGYTFFICTQANSHVAPLDDTSHNYWDEITVINYDHNRSYLYPDYIPVDGSITSAASNAYVFSNEGKLYKNTSGSAASFDYKDMKTNYKFTETPCYYYASNKVEGEHKFIIIFFSIGSLPASSDDVFDGFSDNTFATWSCKPHGCDVYFIPNAEAWTRLANFYARYNAVSQIVGLYGVPKQMLDRGAVDKTGQATPKLDELDTSDVCVTTVSAARTELTSSGKQKEVRNKKLLTSPFSYLRVIGPDGQIKEYSYENFRDIANGDEDEGKIRFKIIADIAGDAPKMYLIPKNYNDVDVIPDALVQQLNLNADYNNLGDVYRETMKFNLSEAMCVTGFPEISFNTDGYLTFLGSEYAAARANDTTANRVNLEIQEYNTSAERASAKATSDLVGDIFGSVSGASSPADAAVSALGAAVSGTITYGDTIYSAGLNRKQYENLYQKTREAGNWGNGNLLSTDNPYVERFAQAKAAYANSKYVGGTGGIIRYLRGLGLFDFVALHVQLREEVLDYYDDWFDLYGYASGRCGIPYVIQFCRGGSELPHWVATGAAADTTYIKTKDCKVEHAMMPVANAIKQMFDTGVRLKKGDLT